MQHPLHSLCQWCESPQDALLSVRRLDMWRPGTDGLRLRSFLDRFWQVPEAPLYLPQVTQQGWLRRAAWRIPGPAWHLVSPDVILKPQVAREAGPLIINGKNALKVFRGDNVLSIARAAGRSAFRREVDTRRRYADVVPVPLVLEVAERNGCDYVIDEYISGGTAQEVSVEPATLLSQIACILAPLYDRTLVSEEVDVALYIERSLQGLSEEFLRIHGLADIVARAYNFAATQAEISIRLAVAHGDLTPGNVIISADGLVLIDWERSSVRSLFHDVLNLLAWYEVFGGHSALFNDVLMEPRSDVLAPLEQVMGGRADRWTRTAYAVVYVVEKLAVQAVTAMENPKLSRRRLRRWQPFFERVLATAEVAKK